MRRARPAFLVLFAALTLEAFPLFGQSSAMEELRKRLEAPNQFGGECCQLLSIPAAAFRPMFDSSSLTLEDAVGYVRTNGALWAPVMLPTGAVLDNIDYYYFDDASINSCATLVAYRGPTLLGAPPSADTIGTACSEGDGGYGYALAPMSGTINNSVWFGGGGQYVVRVSATGIGDAVFKGVTIWWHREVKPPPATATFNDVPVNHPQFQYIEALVEAGVTAGCGGGNYCPDNPLTRGQMAVFLAKALGLYWPF